MRFVQVLHLNHIGPLRPDANGSMFILVIIDVLSRWVELYPTKTTTATETASCIFQHFGHASSPEVVHTDRGTAFKNVYALTRFCAFDLCFRTVVRGKRSFDMRS